ncbi:MAG: TetR/AcrR family transcriptional regulator [Spirochaetia bacterium]|nr:TetR/AcrR family transcriptional regulator [Spirochaetia bacterium]
MKKPYHHGNLREELVRAGITLLSREGASGLRLREVAGVAGVSHAAVYRHFANKEDLLASIAEEGFLGLVRRVEVYQKRATTQRKQYLESGRAYVEFALDHPEQFRIMFSGLIRDRTAYPTLAEAAEKSFNQLVTIVEECRTSGLIPAHKDRRVHALAVWSMLHGIANLLIEGQFASGRARTRYLTHALLGLLIA